MTDTDWLDQLEQKAAAATPGPWFAGDAWVYTGPIYPDDNRLSDVLGMKFADPARATAERERGLRNAEFIAAANPHTVQRLLRALDEAGTEAMHARDLVSLLREERDTLRSKVAAVEALEGQWRRLAEQVVGDAESRELLYAAARNLRAALADGSTP